uniref:Protein arginine methyltransferase NDUFAF7 n=1 Tax=Panagrolaimus sp. ES5 TaxID=591445 RepID=A0AC34GN62_9BILA
MLSFNRLKSSSSLLIRRFTSCQRLRKEIINPNAATKKSDEALHFFIRDKIKASGPITVLEYMELVAGSAAGYYVNKSAKDDGKIFGASGDFITAPELTQVFGELLAVWIYNELGNCGHTFNEWQLVELGPGTGNLMADMLGAFKKLKEDDKLTVHFVEISDSLIDEQERRLCNQVTKNVEGKSYFTVFVGSEFLDALPIHQFTKDDKGWHKVYVNLDANEQLKFMLSKYENLHTKGLLPEAIRNDEKRKNWEVSPEAGTIVNQITEKVMLNGGFALFVDYAHDGSREELSLRAYHKHTLVDPLASPGKNDITADVNFGYLKSLNDDRVLVFGPQEQRWFLSQLGILTRMQYLMKIAKSKEDKENLFNAFKLLMTGNDQGGKGESFKCFSIFPKTLLPIIEKRGGFPDGFRPFGMKAVEKDSEKL